MVALAERGCEVSESQLLDEIKAHLPDTEPRLNADSESYALGALAGALLRERGQSNWHSRIEEGETFQGLLLDEVAPEQQPDNAQLRETVQSRAESRNEDLDQRIGDSLASFEGDNHYRLVIDMVDSVGSYSRSGSFLLVEEPLLESVNLGISGQFDHGAIISLESADTFNLDGSPCVPGMGVPAMVLVPKPQVDLATDGTAEATTDAVSFSDLEVQAQSWNGIEWLCPLN